MVMCYTYDVQTVLTFGGVFWPCTNSNNIINNYKQ